MNGYELAADSYERHRPTYPPTAIQHLTGRLRISSTSTVLDLGAGTGKLTRLLVPRAGKVIAVEPSTAMRTALQAAVPAAGVIAGRAEKIPLASDSVDAVVVAQAFHWFDGPHALSEMARVLQPGGHLGLIWNTRDESTEPQRRISSLLSIYRGGSRTYRNSRWQQAFESVPAFSPLESTTFNLVHPLDRAGLIGLVMSISYMALLTGTELADATAMAAAIHTDHADEDGMVRLAYSTVVYTSRLS